MLFYGYHQILLIFLILVTSSQAIFFHYSKNVLSHFFDSLRGKKELKPLPNIHHYHLHYYPLFVHSTHSMVKTVKAPDKHELEQLHTNQLDSLGWSNSAFKYTPNPTIAPIPSLDPWPSANDHFQRPWQFDERSLDHQEETKPSQVVVHVPLQQQIVLNNPEKDEGNPLLSFFNNLRKIKNSIFQSSSPASKKSDFVDNQSNDVILFPPANFRQF